MNNVTETVKNFEEFFEKQYLTIWKKAIKQGNSIQSFFCMSSKNEPFASTILSLGNNNSCVCQLVFYDINDEFSFKLDNLIEFLTEKEKTEYIKKQNSLYENDDYLFYNIYHIMLNWIKSYASHAIDEYIEKYFTKLLKQRLVNFKSTNSYKTIIARVKHIAEKNIKVSEALDIKELISKLEDEKNELCCKIDRLEKFIHSSEIFETLPSAEKAAMKEQLKGMLKYANALKLRIDLITQRGEKDVKSK